VGGNDLDTPATPQEVAEARVKFAQLLHDNYDISFLALSTILPRDNPRSMDPDRFRLKMDETNTLTSQLISGISCLYFHRHRGFWRDSEGNVADTTLWSTDGVHPNTDQAISKYQRSMTSCMHNMIKTYRSSIQ
jgi:hypothetical protein